MLRGVAELDFRGRMVAAIAERLGVTLEDASDAMHAAWAATADDRSGSAPPSWQPDLSDPGQALARRVQAALEREFGGEPLFPCVVVVQEPLSNRVGLAVTAIGLGEADTLLMLGRGAVRRTRRHYGDAS